MAGGAGPLPLRAGDAGPGRACRTDNGAGRIPAPAGRRPARCVPPRATASGGGRTRDVRRRSSAKRASAWRRAPTPTRTPWPTTSRSCSRWGAMRLLRHSVGAGLHLDRAAGRAADSRSAGRFFSVWPASLHGRRGQRRAGLRVKGPGQPAADSEGLGRTRMPDGPTAVGLVGVPHPTAAGAGRRGPEPADSAPAGSGQVRARARAAAETGAGGGESRSSKLGGRGVDGHWHEYRIPYSAAAGVSCQNHPHQAAQFVTRTPSMCATLCGAAAHRLGVITLSRSRSAP